MSTEPTAGWAGAALPSGGRTEPKDRGPAAGALSGAVVLPNEGRNVPKSDGPGAAEGVAQSASAAAAGAAATSPALATCTGAGSPQVLPSGGLTDPNTEEDPAVCELPMGGRTEPNTVVTECTEAHCDAGGTTKPQGDANGCAATDAFPCWYPLSPPDVCASLASTPSAAISNSLPALKCSYPTPARLCPPCLQPRGRCACG